MAHMLPQVKHNGKMYWVDFRLGELRSVTTARPIRFADLKGGPNTNIKKKLRALRAESYRQEYTRGLDD